jgi:hypothetical protein
MPIHGSIEEAGLADVLQLLALGRKTGCLSVSDGTSTGEIYLDTGRVTFASVANRRDRLGDLLVKTGRITREALREVVDQQAQGNKRQLGRLLVDQGRISRATLEKAIVQQVEEAIYTLFAWKKGNFTFQTDARPVQHTLLSSLDPERLLLEGARRVDEWSLIEKKIPSFDMVYRHTRVRHDRASEKSLTEEQRAILPLLDGTRDVAAVVELTGLDEFDVGKALYGLIMAGYVQLVERRAKIRHLDYRELLAYVVREAEFADQNRRKDAGRHIADCPTCTERLRQIHVRRTTESASPDLDLLAKLEREKLEAGGKVPGAPEPAIAEMLFEPVGLDPWRPEVTGEMRVPDAAPVAEPAAEPVARLEEEPAAQLELDGAPLIDHVMKPAPEPEPAASAPPAAVAPAATPRERVERRRTERRTGRDRRTQDRRHGVERRRDSDPHWLDAQRERREGPRRALERRVEPLRREARATEARQIVAPAPSQSDLAWLVTPEESVELIRQSRQDMRINPADLPPERRVAPAAASTPAAAGHQAQAGTGAQAGRAAAPPHETARIEERRHGPARHEARGTVDVHTARVAPVKPTRLPAIVATPLVDAPGAPVRKSLVIPLPNIESKALKRVGMAAAIAGIALLAYAAGQKSAGGEPANGAARSIPPSVEAQSPPENERPAPERVERVRNERPADPSPPRTAAAPPVSPPRTTPATPPNAAATRLAATAPVRPERGGSRSPARCSTPGRSTGTGTAGPGSARSGSGGAGPGRRDAAGRG